MIKAMSISKTIVFYLILFLFAHQNLSAKTFNRSYAGWMKSEYWKFEFKKNGNCIIRSSHGVDGNTKVQNKYKIKGDTIYFISRYHNTIAPLKPAFILDGDSLLISLVWRYDFKLIKSANAKMYNSKIRKIKYPQLAANTLNQKSDLEKVLNLAFNSKEMKSFYHFDQVPERELIIAAYYHLEANVQVGSKKSYF